MNTPVGVERCFSFINCQLQPPTTAKPGREPRHAARAVTISRQSGCGARIIAEMLGRYLQSHSAPGAPPWTIFDRNLVETVLADHQLPVRLARFMPEDRVREVDDILDELFGLHPPTWTLVQQTSETVRRLIELGHVIILGRGANIIAARTPHVVHVRLVSSLECRIERRMDFESLERKEAAARIREEDLGRERYLKKHFDKDINDPLLYHLMINTDAVLPEAAAQIIGELALRGVPVPAARAT
jgi:cytidylate kinase